MEPSEHPEPMGTRSSTPPLLGPPEAAWRELTEEIWACTRCHLAKTRTHAVAYRGGERPWVVFVGEAPGAEEDRQGLPFVGRGGRRLDRLLESVELSPREYGIVNLLKCRPPRNRFDREAAQVCRPLLDRQLELLAPKALVSLGSNALHALDPGAPPMLRASGTGRSALGLPLFPLIHPAATLRSRRMGERWTEDERKLSRWLAALRPARP